LSTNKKKRIVVIGGVAAGTSTASKARRIDHEADVKIIQEESLVSYGACVVCSIILIAFFHLLSSDASKQVMA